MTYKQYIENPLGKKNSVFSQRDLYKDFYMRKFDNIILREAGKIDYTLLYDKANDAYYCHIKIPSETVAKLYYDVVIKFTTDDNALRPLPSLKGYDVSFFSNDPSFVFTYMYVFKENDMLIEELKSKCPKMALTEAPEVRNPNEIVGYVKTLYFAYIYMDLKNLFHKNDYKMNGLPFTKQLLLENVMDADEKIEQRQNEEPDVKTKKELPSVTKKNGKKVSDKYIAKPVIGNLIKSHMISPKEKIKPKAKISKISKKKKSD